MPDAEVAGGFLCEGINDVELALYYLFLQMQICQWTPAEC